nr:hypothetical protein CFP56_57116 [Quercus suber]
MFGAHLESIDREIGKFSQNSTIGLDGNIDQEKGHTNMKDMDRDYVDQPAKSDGECNAVKGVFNFQARTEDQIKESSSGLEVSTTVVQHANADVLNGIEGVGPQEIKGLDSNTSLPNSAQQHGMQFDTGVFINRQQWWCKKLRLCLLNFREQTMLLLHRGWR